MCHFTKSPNATVAGPKFDRPAACPAKTMQPEQRRDMATRVLGGKESASQAARDNQVSRKFVSKQTAKAKQSLDEAFAPASDVPKDFIFWLPVTKSWIKQTTLGLALTCRGSERGIVQFFEEHLNHHVSLGAVHNTLTSAVAAARDQNAVVDLKKVDVAALDEIFQARQPVLVGADAASSYCFLLGLEEHRDSDTWGLRLLELADRGLAPQAGIADFGSRRRAGMAAAFPDVCCRGDVFHALMDLNKAARALANRAYRAIEHRSALERKQATQTRRTGRPNRSLSHRIGRAKGEELAALTLADDVYILSEWLQKDILAVAGPNAAIRRDLYDFVVTELRLRLDGAGTNGKCVGSVLGHHRDDLLAFADQLDHDLAVLAQQCEVESSLLRDLLQHQTGNRNDPGYWQREAELHQRSRGRFYQLQRVIRQLYRRTVRASSVIENLNSRLRSYFFLRRHLGPDYLQLLQFYLNHRPFPRSDRPERKGKSPRELLTGQAHPHWLELLGFQRFERN
jgi:hypothetical protein